jgi:hypothetical protein
MSLLLHPESSDTPVATNNEILISEYGSPRLEQVKFKMN